MNDEDGTKPIGEIEQRFGPTYQSARALFDPLREAAISYPPRTSTPEQRTARDEYYQAFYDFSYFVLRNIHELSRDEIGMLFTFQGYAEQMKGVKVEHGWSLNGSEIDDED